MKCKYFIIPLLLLSQLLLIQCKTNAENEDANIDNKDSINVETQLIETKTINEFKASLVSLYDVKEPKERCRLKTIDEVEGEATTQFEYLFKAKNFHNTVNSYHKNRKQRIHFSVFNYNDHETVNDIKTKSINCVPFECAKLSKGKTTGAKITPAIYIFNNHSIASISIACEDRNQEWERIKTEFIKAFKYENAVLIEAECGKISWIE